MNGSRIPRHLFLLLSCLVLPAICGGGCAGSRQALEQQIKELQSQLITLGAERANLAARNAALDDRLLLLEARRQACADEERRRRKLQVVRLTAESVGEREPLDRPAAAPAVPDEEGPRPVLRLSGGGTGQSRGGGGASGSSGGLPPVPVGGDDLGVVPMGAAPAETPRKDEAMELFQNGYRAHANGDHRGALQQLARFLEEHPGHPFADNAMFWRGESLLARGEPLRAIGEWERMLTRHPRSEKAASALYRIGFAYDRLGDPAKAGEYYFRVVERHPGTDAARKASRRVMALREAGRAGDVMPAAAMR